MSVNRIMGIETEYGVVRRGDVYANPMLMSSQIVLGYRDAFASGRRARWDYLDENPLRDARGFELQRASAHPSLLTDDPSRPAPSGDSDEANAGHIAVQEQERPRHAQYEDPGAANVILTNGARLYVDHAHPEYSSPEVTNPIDAVIWDRAGEIIMREGAREASALTESDMVVFKNNVDGKGASYGTHENYLVDREVPFGNIVRALTPFFVTRPVYAGAGRVGIGQRGEIPGFQLSQRADYMEAEVGLETTMRRPIINTRDEPHADRDRWRRLHVIIGDANLFEFPTYLKMGATACVLWLIEQWGDELEIPQPIASLELRDPVASVEAVSRDLTLSAQLPLVGGKTASAVEIQRTYIAAIRDERSRLRLHDHATERLLADWESVLDDLVRDRASAADRVEWAAKLQLLERMRERDALAWDNARLAAFDIQWADVRPGRGIAAKLRAAGATRDLVTPEQIAAAVTAAPTDTRAYFRGGLLEKFPSQVVGASWDTVILDVPGSETLSRIPMPDPARGTREHVGAILDQAGDVAELIAALAR
ncbi:depupylase/deamidase Dop [Rarobacter incanus]|uniref:Proteasome accessory factor A n=1 Tax=Rarobacter incanus TaxID=153494 RepID=A0A542SLY4_9MICO|nr:depupylase/deamidase Dop [Rarobacter incanus]TQK75633.1 proteasome accessory factor A [Rarobacter incanus]